MQKTLGIASDHAGFALKEQLKREVEALGYGVEDLGTRDKNSVDYPDYAEKLAQWMKTRGGSKGILICGSGIGMCIAANRHRHIRAALCRDGLEARLARRHNDANVLCLGARLIGSETARDCAEQFLSAAFEGGRHQARVEKLG